MKLLINPVQFFEGFDDPFRSEGMGFIIEVKATVRDDAPAQFVLACLPAFQADNLEFGAHDEGNVVFEKLPSDPLGSIAHGALDQINEIF